MENKIFIEITGKSNMDEVNQELDKSQKYIKALEQRIQEISKAEAQDIAQLRKEYKGRADLDRILDKNIKYYRDEIKARKDEIASTQRSITLLEQNAKAANLMENSTNRVSVQLRAMRELMMQMEEEDNLGEAYTQLAVKASKLQDKLGDTQERIRVLASDTRNLDAAMSLGSGVAGAFNVAASAAELLGNDAEGLQQAFYKVQAVMSVVNGLQEVQALLVEESAAKVVIKTAIDEISAKATAKKAAAETIFTKASWASSAATAKDTVVTLAKTAATKAAAAAQWLWNAALTASPIGLVVAAVAALVAGIVAVTHKMGLWQTSTEKREKAEKRLERSMRSTNALIQRQNEAIERQRTTHSRMIDVMEAEGKTEAEIHKAKMKNLREEIDGINKKIAARIASVEAIKAELVASGKVKYLNADHTLVAGDSDAIDQWKDLQESVRELKKTRDELQHELTIETKTWDTKEREEAAQRARDAADEAKARAEQAAQEARDRAEQRKQEVLQAAKDLEDANIENMAEGAEKERKQIELNFQRRLAEIKGNSNEEIALRKALEEQKRQQLEAVDKKYADEALESDKELAKLRLDNAVEEAKKQGGDVLLKAQQDRLNEMARMEIEEIERTEKNEELRAERIKAVRYQLASDLKELEQGTADDIESTKFSALEREVKQLQRLRDSETSTLEERLLANSDFYEAQKRLFDAQEADLNDQFAQGKISYERYQDALLNLEIARQDAALDYEKTHQDLVVNTMQQTLDLLQQSLDTVFTAASDLIQQQIDKLDEMYTTDWEEAQKNANKKYITEEEYEKKKAALEMKQAKFQKAQAITDIGIQTALAIISAWAQPGPLSLKIATSALAAAMGATQLAVAMAKPLAQYEKGRNGGPGEYALVGEKGPELMYVPQGASIVPNNKMNTPSAWGRYGVPVPEMPSVPNDALQAAMEWRPMGFDYDKLGRAVAQNMPAQRPVTVNVDRRGITVDSGAERRTHMNAKYSGSWR